MRTGRPSGDQLIPAGKTCGICECGYTITGFPMNPAYPRFCCSLRKVAQLVSSGAVSGAGNRVCRHHDPSLRPPYALLRPSTPSTPLTTSFPRGRIPSVGYLSAFSGDDNVETVPEMLGSGGSFRLIANRGRSVRGSSSPLWA